MEEELERARSEAFRTTELLAEVKSELRVAELKLSELEDNLEQSALRSRELQFERRCVEEQYIDDRMTFEMEVQRLRAEVKAGHDASVVEKQATESRLSDLSVALDESNIYCRKLQADFDRLSVDSNHQVQNITAEFFAAKGAIDEAESEVLRLKDLLGVKSKESLGLEEKVEELQASHLSIENDLLECNRKFDTANDRAASLENLLLKVRSALLENEAFTDKLREDYNAVKDSSRTAMEAVMAEHSALQTSLEEISEARVEADKTIAQLQHSLELLEKEKLSLQRQADEYVNQKSSFEEKLAALQQSNDTLAMESNDLSEKFARTLSKLTNDRDAMHLEHSAMINNYEERMEEITASRDSHHTKALEMSVLKDGMENEIINLKASFAEVERSLNAKYNKLLSTRNELSNTLATLNGELQETIDKRDELRTQLHKTYEERDVIEKLAEDAIAAKEFSEREILDQKISLDKVGSDLEEFKNLYENLKASSAVALSRISKEHHADKAKFAMEMESFQKHLDGVILHRETLKQELNSCKLESFRLRVEKGDSMKEIKDLKTSEEESRDRFSQLEQSLHDLKNESGKISDELVKLRRNYTEMANEREKIKADLRNCQKERDDALATHESTLLSLEESVQMCVRLKESYNALKESSVAAIRNVESEHEALQESMHLALSEENSRLVMIESLENQIAHSNAERTKLHEAISAMTKKVNDEAEQRVLSENEMKRLRHTQSVCNDRAQQLQTDLANLHLSRDNMEYENELKVDALMVERTNLRDKFFEIQEKVKNEVKHRIESENLVKSMKHDLSESEDRTRQLQADLEKMHSSSDDAAHQSKLELDSVIAERKKFLDEVTRMRKEIDNEAIQRIELEDKLASMRGAFSESEEKIRNLQEILMNLRTSKIDAVRESGLKLDAFNEERARLQDKIAEMEAKVKYEVKERGDSEDKLNSLRHALSEREERTKQLEEDLRGLRSSFFEAAKESELNVQSMASSLQEKESNVQQLQTELLTLRSSSKEMLRQMEQKQDSLEESLRAAVQANNNAGDVRAQLAKDDDALNELRHQISALHDKLRNKSEAAKELALTEYNLRQRVDDLNADNVSLRSILEDQRLSLDALNKSVKGSFSAQQEGLLNSNILSTNKSDEVAATIAMRAREAIEQRNAHILKLEHKLTTVTATKEAQIMNLNHELMLLGQKLETAEDIAAHVSSKASQHSRALQASIDRERVVRDDEYCRLQHEIVVRNRDDVNEFEQIRELAPRLQVMKVSVRIHPSIFTHLQKALGRSQILFECHLYIQNERDAAKKDASKYKTRLAKLQRQMFDINNALVHAAEQEGDGNTR